LFDAARSLKTASKGKIIGSVGIHEKLASSYTTSNILQFVT
jgi:hypothetical protein